MQRPTLGAVLACGVIFTTSACEKKHDVGTRAPDPTVPGVASGHAPDKTASQGAPTDLPLDRIRLPKGFHIAVYASEVKNARSLALGPDGTLYVGTRTAGKVYAIPNHDGDVRGDRVVTIASGLTMPNGVALRAGALFVAERSRILRFDDIAHRLDASPEPVVVKDGLPKEDHHGWKFIAFGPDGYLYVPIGAPCNLCESKEPEFATITRMHPDGSGFEVYASGIRNSVGFDFHPETKDFWFTENGRDELGDDVPADELNKASKAGMHFGYPYCHEGAIADPEFGAKRQCSEFTPPEQKLGPHVAALGMRFYTGSQFPPEYKNQVFIAEHGSWNRSTKIGYRVMLVRMEAGKPKSYEVFADGWLKGDDVWGRPVDVLVTPDGALLVSDDEAGAIYRISYAPA